MKQSTAQPSTLPTDMPSSHHSSTWAASRSSSGPAHSRACVPPGNEAGAPGCWDDGNETRPSHASFVCTCVLSLRFQSQREDGCVSVTLTHPLWSKASHLYQQLHTRCLALCQDPRLTLLLLLAQIALRVPQCRERKRGWNQEDQHADAGVDQHHIASGFDDRAAQHLVGHNRLAQRAGVDVKENAYALNQRPKRHCQPEPGREGQRNR